MKSTLLRPLQLVVAVFLLTSCNSFNTVNEYSRLSNEYLETYVFQEPPSADTAASSPGQSETLCPAFKLPELDKTPELPLKELQRIKPGDHATLDAVVQKHIRDLRAHVIKMRLDINRAHSDYLKSCRVVSIR